LGKGALPYFSLVIPAKERVKKFDTERFLTLRRAQDEEKAGIFTSC
jgi:hypothetical protein